MYLRGGIEEESISLNILRFTGLNTAILYDLFSMAYGDPGMNREIV